MKLKSSVVPEASAPKVPVPEASSSPRRVRQNITKAPGATTAPETGALFVAAASGKLASERAGAMGAQLKQDVFTRITRSCVQTRTFGSRSGRSISSTTGLSTRTPKTLPLLMSFFALSAAGDTTNPEPFRFLDYKFSQMFVFLQEASHLRLKMERAGAAEVEDALDVDVADIVL